MPKYCRTRKSAIKLNRLYYKTGKPCNRGHVSKRFTKTGRCVECDSLNKKSRYLIIKERTPAWVVQEEIDIIYQASQELGEDYHVDHDIPLQGDIVSGLHVPENLKILKRNDNLKKRNNYVVD